MNEHDGTHINSTNYKYRQNTQETTHIDQIKGISKTKLYTGGNWTLVVKWLALPGSSVVKNSPANGADAGDTGSITGSARSPGEEKGNPPQHSCPGNHTDKGAWEAMVYRGCRVGHDCWAHTHFQTQSKPGRPECSPLTFSFLIRWLDAVIIQNLQEGPGMREQGPGTWVTTETA